MKKQTKKERIELAKEIFSDFHKRLVEELGWGNEDGGVGESIIVLVGYGDESRGFLMQGKGAALIELMTQTAEGEEDFINCLAESSRKRLDEVLELLEVTDKTVVGDLKA